MSTATKESAGEALSVAIIPHIIQPKTLYRESISIGRVHCIERLCRPLNINVQNVVVSAEYCYEV